MARVLYVAPTSPAVRAVQITARAIGVDLEERLVNLYEKEQLTAEFLKLNPQHTVPVFVDDDGFVLWDSHAINTYLVSKYSQDDSLYPKDLAKRAVVDQRLHFDSGVAFAAIRTITHAIFGGKTVLDESDIKSVDAVYGFLEGFLDGKEWICGDSLTLADYHLYTSVNLLDLLVPLDEERFPLVVSWMQKVDALDEVEVSRPGLAMCKETIESLLK